MCIFICDVNSVNKKYAFETSLSVCLSLSLSLSLSSAVLDRVGHTMNRSPPSLSIFNFLDALCSSFRLGVSSHTRDLLFLLFPCCIPCIIFFFFCYTSFLM